MENYSTAMNYHAIFSLVWQRTNGSGAGVVLVLETFYASRASDPKCLLPLPLASPLPFPTELGGTLLGGVFNFRKFLNQAESYKKFFFEVILPPGRFTWKTKTHHV